MFRLDQAEIGPGPVIRGSLTKACAERTSNISRTSNNSSANASVKPFRTQRRLGCFSISPKRLNRSRNSRTAEVLTPISRAKSASLI